MQLTIQSQGDVTTVVSISVVNAVNTGGVPLVSRSLSTRLAGAVRFNDVALRTANTTYAFVWSSVGSPVRSSRPPPHSNAHTRRPPGRPRPATIVPLLLLSDAPIFFCPRATLQSVDLSSTAVAPAGRTSFNLVIAPNVLTAGATYTFRLNVTSSYPSGRGQAEIQVQVNTVRCRSSAMIGTTGGMLEA